LTEKLLLTLNNDSSLYGKPVSPEFILMQAQMIRFSIPGIKADNNHQITYHCLLHHVPYKEASNEQLR